MIRNNFHGVIGLRELCNHNLRFRVPSKSNICLICHCNKIDDILSVESNGKRKLSSADIRDIIHQFRVLNSVLDVPFEENLVETLLSPVLKTSLAALKIHNDEIGTFVSQAVEKISGKVPQNMMENFLEKLSAQILEKTSFGNLNCLFVLLRHKADLEIFLKNFGTTLLPTLLQLLNQEAPKVIFKCPPIPGVRTKAQSAATNDSSTDYSWHESLRVVEKLFDVLEAIYPGDISLLVNENGDSQVSPFPHSQECIQIFSQYMKEIIGVCGNLLSSSHSSGSTQMPQFHIKVLRFLEKLNHHPKTLRFIFADNTGMVFCSMIKKLLYTHSIDVKTAALSLVNRMLVTYKYDTDDTCANEVVPTDFPSVISQVDLIHFITEAMNTSSENLFRMALEVLNNINSIPMFRQGRMIPVLESALRISTMRIPESLTDPKTYTALNDFLLNVLTSLENIPKGMLHQLMYLFESLPKKWTATQYLPWIKLLVFCGREAELQGNLWKVFVFFVQRSKNVGNCYSVAPLKCALLIVYALMECKVPPKEKTNSNLLSKEHLDQNWRIFLLMMDFDFLPVLMTLFLHGVPEDCIYTIIMLNLFKMYPERYLKMESMMPEPETLVFCKVEYDSLLFNASLGKEVGGNAYYMVKVNKDSAVRMSDGFWCWTPKVLMQLLGTVRLNSEFMANRKLFELWNENMSRILAYCCTFHLPQIHTTIGSVLEENSGNEETPLQKAIKSLLGELDLDVTCWSRILEKDYNIPEGALTLNLGAMQDVVLAFYFCYAHYVGKDIVRFLDEGFAKRLAGFMESCVEKYNETQEIQDFGWLYVGFYFRVCLMIASVLPRNSKDVISLCDKFELLWKEVPEAEHNFKFDVMIYHRDVFIFLFKTSFFSAYEQLLEFWLSKDRKACISFLTSTAIAPFDVQLNTEINHSLLAMAARGNLETSALAVELSSKRLKKAKIGFEFSLFLSYLHDLIRTISNEESSGRSSNPINSSRLSNVMQLALQDEFLLSPENPFPLDLLRQLVTIMLKFHDVPIIGRKSLHLLSKILRNNITFNDARTYVLQEANFIQYLGTKLHHVDLEDPEELLYAYKLLNFLIQQTEIPGFLEENNPNGATRPMIKWKIASVFSYIHEVPKPEILEFVLTLLKINFTNPLIQVEECSSPKLLADSLLNLFFHVQALILKVTAKRVRDLLWEISSEHLRLAEEGRTVKHSTFQSDVLFQPWIKVSLTNLLSGCKHTPSKLDLKPLAFLEKWTHLMLKNKLENPSKRTRILERMVFAPYLKLIKNICNDMKNDRTQVVIKQKTNPVKQGPPIKIQGLSIKCCQIFDIEKKTKNIAQIAKNCEAFLLSFETL